MSFEYSTVREERDAQRLAVAASHAFHVPVEDVLGWWEKADPANLRVVREEGDVVGGGILIRMGQFFGGQRLSMRGVAGVAVLPEARGRGAARFLMHAALHEMRADGELVSTLYATSLPLYRSVGYERAGTREVATMRIRDVPRLRAPGRTRPLRPEDDAFVRELALERARRSNGNLDRGEYVWLRVRGLRGRQVRGYRIDGAGGPEGYVWLHMPPASREADTLEIADWGAATPAALETLVAFLAGHATIWRRVSWPTGPRDPLFFWMPEPRIEVRERMDWMLRLVDVPRALEARGWTGAPDGELHLEVRDPTLPANDGRLVLSLAGGRASARPGGEGRVSLDVGALAALFSGHASAEELALLGRLEASPAEAARATRAFLLPAPEMPDFF